MKARRSIFEKWIEANPERVAAGIVAVIIATVLIAWLTSSSGLFDGPSLQRVYVSPPSPVYADEAYSDIQVAVNNVGNVTAEGCSVTASDHDETLVLGESERFSLPPQGGHFATVSIYLPYVGGEALSQGEEVRAHILLRAECSNAIQTMITKELVLSGSPLSVSEDLLP
jgi:hypothetical protein